MADALVPPSCLNCRAALMSRDALCPACWRQVRFIRPPLCDRLGIPLTWGHGERVISAAAAAEPPVYDRARAALHFDHVARDMIHAFKYGDRHDSRRLFARWMVIAGADLLSEADFIVPVPLHRWRLMTRRYNQAALLCQDLATLCGVAWRSDVLLRVKNTRQQVGLSEAERRDNMAGAFRVPPSKAAAISGKAVVIVDDVITTGATISAATRALRRAGARRVDVLALAMVTEDSRIGL
jgi:ComF family protein